MPLKVFISYRRQDTAASAIGIGQYLEKEFGRKNVYIDVDMQAGTKYPAVIQKRLAECTVLLVLIGPNWLRLQKPNDWVQLEITYALKQAIAVIPVLIEGAQLPDKETLPDDIKGLLDHQAASVSLAGFRHEMAGLVRDIRSIRTPKPWRVLGAIAATLILSVTAGILVYAFGFYNLLGRTRLPAPSPEVTNGVWKSGPGEWVMFAVENQRFAQHFNPSSMKILNDKVWYTTRSPLESPLGATANALTERVYEDVVTNLDCKNWTSVPDEGTVYNKNGEAISHFKLGELETLVLPNWIKQGTVDAQHILCNDQLRTPLLSKAQTAKINFTELSNLPNEEGKLFYGRPKALSTSDYAIEVLVVLKFFADHKSQEFFLEKIFLGSRKTIVPSRNLCN